METRFHLPLEVLNELPSTSIGQTETKKHLKVFHASSERHIQFRSISSTDGIETDEVAYAAVIKVKVINKDASDIIKQANQKSPLRAVKIKKTYKQAMESVAPLFCCPFLLTKD